ncbi:hypothetical protein CEXT_489821 [Caerostris extrusa]|uniref:Uncharacterized protein n=1 Tax=Caerostris extrusa TaxID=172846 RepID=A0AAV4N8U8_CAEEX|nr:hypothetical protein CEXT_489821 [Caerostris extrusa]
MLPFQDRSQEPKLVSITNSHAPDIPEPCPIQSYKQMHTKQNRFGHFSRSSVTQYAVIFEAIWGILDA